MASKQSTVDSILTRLAGSGNISAKKMFGEYGLFLSGRMIGFICDDELLFKPTKRGRELFSELVEAAPYPGAKPCFLVPKERWSKRDWLVKVAIATASEIPVPEKTKREKKKRA